MSMLNAHMKGRERTINERSLLAPNYVYGALKNINMLDATWVIPAEEKLSLDQDIKGLRQSLFVKTPCLCGLGQPNVGVLLHSSNEPPELERVDDEDEFRFAVSRKLQDIEKERSRSAMVDSIVGMSDYASTFASLLDVERKALLMLHERLSQYDADITVLPPPTVGPTGVALTNNEKRFVILNAIVKIPGIADVSPPLLTGDSVLIRPLRPLSLPGAGNQWTPANNLVEIQSQIRVVSRTRKMVSRPSEISDQVVITWVSQSTQDLLSLSYPEGRFNFRFVPSPLQYQSCKTAIAWLANFPSAVSTELLFPMEAPILSAYDDSKVLGHDFKTLNEKQKSFVKMVCARTASPSKRICPPMILTGPAGTGKTKTLLFSILEVLQMGEDRHILMCTPSHTACDVITKRLGKHLDKSQLFRLYGANRPIATVPVEILPYTRQSSHKGTFTIPGASEIWEFKVIVCTCSDAHILYRAGLTNQHVRGKRECIKAYAKHILHLSGLKNEISGEDTPHFTHLFIDEAAQATEPETLIPFSVVLDPSPTSSKTEIVLVGDPRQLSPRIFSNEASECGLGRSFLERLLQRPVNCLGGGVPHMLGQERPKNNSNGFRSQLWTGYDEQLCIFLTQNYRGHPSFLMMPSALFYFDKLEAFKGLSGESTFLEKLRKVELLSKPVSTIEVDVTIPEILQTKKQLHWPIHFLGVSGADTSTTVEFFVDSNSWSNSKEAHAVVLIVERLHAAGISSSSIGVMSPFRGQVVLIRKLLRLKPSLGGVNVGTIEDYQSVECDVIILSLTRSNTAFVDEDTEKRIGVFCQPKTTNVALTRAEHLFIVVGDPVAMLNDSIWKQWLLFCLRNGLWYGEKGATFTDLVNSLASSELSITTHRFGPSHFLLATSSDEDNNVVIISTMEREQRQTREEN